MTGPWSKQRAALSAAWNRFVAVDDPDEEGTRLGRLFCTMMVLTFFVALVLVYLFVSATMRGMFSPPIIGWLGAAFPITFIPLSVFSFLRAKRG